MNGDTPAKDDFGYTIYQVAEAVPLRVIYTVIPRTTVIANGLTSLYMNVNKAPGENAYYFYTNRWRGINGLTTRTDLSNMTMAFFDAADSNQYYAPGGPGTGTMLGVPKAPIPVGLTGSLPFAWDFTHFQVNPTMQVQRLGNNGRLQLQVQATINITKTFSFDDTVYGPAPAGSELTINDVSPISFMLWGRDAAGNLIYTGSIPLGNFSGTGNGPYTISVNVPPGQYVIQEQGGIPLKTGWSYLIGGPAPVAPSTVTTGSPGTANIDNPYMYTGMYSASTLYLYKVFHGLFPGDGSTVPPIPSDYPANIEITLRGPIGEPTEGVFGSPYTLSQINPGPLTINPVVAGNYELTEVLYNVDGYQLTSPTTYSFTIATEQVATGLRVVMDNYYEKIDPNYSLNVNKTTTGLTGETDTAGNPVRPTDLSFKIEQKVPDTWDPANPWNTASLATIQYSDILAGNNTLTNLPAGTYMITEVGGEIPGFDGPKPPVGFSATPAVSGPNPDGTPNSYFFTFTGDNDISFSFTFTNNYSRTPEPPPPTVPPPPPPPPAPQTGVDRNIFIPIAMLSFGFLWIAGAEIYRRKGKEKEK